MSTSKETAEFIEDQLGDLPIRTGRMFGEYALYLGDKVVGFICDDTLFIKPSDVDPAMLAGTFPGQAYPGSKDYHTVPGELLEDREWLQAAISATADALPMPAPKKPKQPKAKANP
ncbi:MAG: TfoX/Sxy family protein [Salinibacterium sp.]|nr:TfoX/Sxy family protein [Salinibacterium sp.]